MKVMMFLYVGLGGALGAMARYAISLIPNGYDFPWLTLITNVIGAVLIGVIVGAAQQSPNAAEALVMFLKTGFCGGFTTFSTFSLEAFTLLDKKAYGKGVAYMALSLVLCLAGVAVGKAVAGLMR